MPVNYIIPFLEEEIVSAVFFKVVTVESIAHKKALHLIKVWLQTIHGNRDKGHSVDARQFYCAHQPMVRGNIERSVWGLS